jgi:uncharacterized membrane protein
MAYAILAGLVVWLIWRRFGRLTDRAERLESRVEYLEARVKLLAGPAPAHVIETPPPVETLVPRPRAPAPAPEPAAPPPPPPPLPHKAAPQARRSLTEALKSRVDVADWETVIGGRWLNKIGIVVLVVGVALFLGYSLRYMGPWGRVATGGFSALTLLIGGLFLQRIKKYALFAKPLVGGGWALLYFTAYAAHNVAAAKVIVAPLGGLALLGAVAAGMILHSLRYRSELATGLAYFLGFVTVAISPMTEFSLAASLVLAVSLVLIVSRTRWCSLGLFGVAATYLNHVLWLEWRMGGFVPRPSLEIFWLGQGMLIMYWLVFSAFDFLLTPAAVRDKRAIGINLGNTVAFLGLSLLQVGAVFPASRFVLTGGAGVAYVVASSLLYALKRRVPHLLDGVVAVALLAVTLPLKPTTSLLAQYWLAPAWLVETAIVLAIGLALREVVFRVEAYALGLIASATLVLVNLLGRPEAPPMLRWLTVVPAVGYLYYAFGRLERASTSPLLRQGERETGIVSSYLATALFVLLLWTELRPELIGLGWLATGLVLVEAGIRLRQPPLRTQAYLCSALAVASLFQVNLNELSGGPEGHRLSRWLTVLPAILALYYLFGRIRRGVARGAAPQGETPVADLASYGGSLLLLVLLWKELDPVAVALAWGVVGLLLVEAGLALDLAVLRRQGHVVAAATFGRLFLANFTAPGTFHGLSHRLITVVPIVAAFYYLRSRLKNEQRTSQAYSFAAAILLMALARFELGRTETVLGWAALGLIWLVLGIRWRDRDLRLQSYLAMALAFGRSWATNFYLTGSYYGLPERIATTIPVIAALYGAQAFCLFNRDAFPQGERGQATSRLTLVDANARVLFSILGSFLLTLLLYYEVQGNLLTIAWAIEGLVILALGFLVRDRTFRLSGLALLLVCLLKVSLVDLQGVETLYRILSFIVLGAILLLVSFAYTKYREVLKRYI